LLYRVGPALVKEYRQNHKKTGLKAKNHSPKS
jgi:hypothetical protein